MQMRSDIGPLADLHILQRARQIGEILGVARDVKADEIAIEQAVEDLLAPRQDVENVRRGKGRVVEKGDLHIGAQPPQIMRHQPQIIVMDPHQRALVRLFRRRLREQPVDGVKGRPVDRIIAVEPGKAVQHRPERLFRGDVVKAVRLFAGQRQAADGKAAIVVVDMDDALEIIVDLRIVRLPRHPGATARFKPVEKAFERRHDPVGALVGAKHRLAIFDRLFIGLAVIDDDQRRFLHAAAPESARSSAKWPIASSTPAAPWPVLR